MDLQEFKYVVISIMGPHAGEAENEIFQRKISDIKAIGRTFWLHKSYSAKPDMVQEICKKAQNEGHDVLCIFIEASQSAAATQTKTADHANEFSSDNTSWSKFSKRLSPVTGKIDSGAYALVFDALRIEHGELKLDLWGYSNFFDPEEPIKIRQRASTLCVLQKDMTRFPISEKIKSRFRRIVAVGNFCEPYAVWLR